MGRVQTARHDGLLRRLFSIKGGGSLLAETLGDAFPVIQLEGGPIELLKLAGWELGIGGILTQSAVGTTASWQLFNPAGSSKLVVPTTCLMSSDTATTVLWGVDAVALSGSAVVGQQRDTREGVAGRTAGIVREQDAVAPLNFGRIQLLVNETFELKDSDGLAVLAPGSGLRFTTLATNVGFRISFLWRERVAEPSELAF